MIKYLAPLLILLAACDTYVEDKRSVDFDPIYLPETEQEDESSDLGTIYQQNKGSLFAMEARAHRMGDILTVSFTESFQATKTQNAASTRSSVTILETVPSGPKVGEPDTRHSMSIRCEVRCDSTAVSRHIGATSTRSATKRIVRVSSERSSGT